MNENYDGGKWGQNTALWAIVVVALVIFAIWLCNKTGKDKADLAASVQGVVSRVNAIEPAVTANANNILGLSNSVAKAQQSIQFIGADVASLDDAVYVSRCGHGRGGLGNDRGAEGLPTAIHKAGAVDADAGGIAHDAGVDIAHAVLVEVGEGKGLQMIEKITAHICKCS